MAGALTALEALVLVGFVVFYVIEMVSGATDDLTRAAVSAVLILVFAVGLLALARGWFRAADWPRTPTVLWNALLLPVAWSLREGDRGPDRPRRGGRRTREHRRRRRRAARASADADPAPS